MSGLRGRAVAAVILGSLHAAIPGSPALADPSVTILDLPFRASEMRGPASRVAATAPSLRPFRDEAGLRNAPLVALWGPGGAALVTLAGDRLRVHPAGRAGDDLAALERPRGGPPGARVAASGPLTVSLAEPTGRYPHAALGSAMQAAALTVAERRPATPSAEPKPVPVDVTRLDAGADAVFEDREPRLADLDGTGEPEIVTVRSFRDRGSALVVYGRRDGAWRLVAETPPDGETARWLNPAAAGGLGRERGVVLVRRPHLDGLLQLWRFERDTLTLVAERAGYANHVYGSTAQELAVLLPDPGRPSRLAVPVLDRTAIAIVSLEPGLPERGRIPLPARAQTGVALLGSGSAAHILVGLEDGRVADIRP